LISWLPSGTSVRLLPAGQYAGFPPPETQGQEKNMMEFQKGEMTNSNGWTLEWGSAYIQVRDENGDFVADWTRAR
jgi:hypothetical protein